MRKQIRQIIQGMPTSDGAGVKLVRVIGQPSLGMLDPFLLLDAFRSDDPEDYIAGFPSHPHRGFETVTYLLNGRMRHKDNAGHEGIIEAGGIQWMTAGRGIIHSEMPEQQNGLLEGFQLWVNLPADHKMDPPRYQEFSAENIPVEERTGAVIRVITGTTSQGTEGPVSQPLTHPLYLDITLESQHSFNETVPIENNTFVYGIQGETIFSTDQTGHRLVKKDQLALLTEGDEIEVKAGEPGSRFLLISGKPLNESVVRGGPFVMNSQEEVRQAFADYQSGNF